MRATTILRRVVGVVTLFVSGMDFDKGWVIDVHPRWQKPRCGMCGRRCPGYDQRPARLWRHLGLGRCRVWLRYAPRRVDCPDCGVRVEQVPWARQESVFTHDFEEMTAYLAQTMDKTAVTKLMAINWRTVGAIVDRVIAERLDPDRFDGLRNIGVDEFNYGKHHRYLTVVVDHDRRRVIWAAKGQGGKTLGKFFDELGPSRIAQLKYVTMDMAAGYIKSVRERAPNAEIVFDRFHVQRLVSNAVDEIRRALVHELAGTKAAAFIKGCRYPTLKNPWNLTRKEKQKLAAVQHNNKALYRAYLLKEAFAAALDYRQPKRARRALDEWLAWAFRCRLRPMIKAARTIKKHKEDILRYVKARLTNGIVEGFNTRTRMVTRRAFGFHSAKALIAMIYLCCGRIELDPALP